MKLLKTIAVVVLVVLIAVFAIAFSWVAYFCLSVASLFLTGIAWLIGEKKTWKGLFEEMAKDFYESNDPFYAFDEKVVERKH